MVKSYLIGLTTSLLGFATIAAYAAPAPADGTGVWPQATYIQTPCGGDFGLLGNIETEQEGVAQANPTNAPVCD